MYTLKKLKCYSSKHLKCANSYTVFRYISRWHIMKEVWKSVHKRVKDFKYATKYTPSLYH